MVEQPPKKPGRPPTPADQQATPVRIERRHVAILDELIRDDVSRVFSAGMKAEEEQAQAQGTLPPGETYYLERRVHLATERRRLLGELGPVNTYLSASKMSTKWMKPMNITSSFSNRENIRR